jgi:RNA polymerase sigma-70 factor (ECF subfamily)
MVRNKCIDSLRRLVSKRSMTVPQVSMTREEEVLFNRAFTADTDEGLLLEELDAAIKAVTDSLTPRCREIFQLSRVQGLSNKAIAERLGISEDGVKVRLKHAYEKLGVGDRAGAISVAVRRGIARPAGMS